MMDITDYYRKEMTLADVIDHVKMFMQQPGSIHDRFPYVYGDLGIDEQVCLDTVCVLDDEPTVVGSEELFPEYVVRHHLGVISSGEICEDVYLHVEDAYPNFTPHQYVEALNYYLDNDTFFEFEDS